MTCISAWKISVSAWIFCFVLLPLLTCSFYALESLVPLCQYHSICNMLVMELESGSKCCRILLIFSNPKSNGFTGSLGCRLKIENLYATMQILAGISLVCNTRFCLCLCQVAEFGKAVRRYIESCDVGNGGDFWPIVKHVSVRIPHCSACSSGAVLVDLPGIGDSNAARDKIAKNVRGDSFISAHILPITACYIELKSFL